MTSSPRSDRDSNNQPFVRAMVPVVVAAGAVTLALAVVRGEPLAREPAAAAAAEVPPSPDADLTPYSRMHRRVAEAPGAPDPLPPTF